MNRLLPLFRSLAHSNLRVLQVSLVATALATSSHGQGTTTLYVGRHFEVRDHDQPVKYIFKGDTRVARVSGSLSSGLRVQRIRASSGWNLCSLAVTATNALDQLASALSPEPSAFRWNAATLSWLQVSPTDTLSVDTVLWLKAITNVILAITGTYQDPTNRMLAPNGDFLPGAGLEAWDIKSAIANVPSASAWLFAARWAPWQVAPLQPKSGLPPFLGPGAAIFMRADSRATLEVPKSALRIRYYHQDHLGSSSVMTDAIGTPIGETGFYPFGAVRHEQQKPPNSEPYQFTQKEADRESGLQYFEARFLAAGLGRFTRLDPLAGSLKPSWLANPQKLNHYAYTQNQPMLFTDPTGTDRFSRQEADLQRVLSASFDAGTLPANGAKTVEGYTERLSNRQYAALTSVYERMQERGLWQYVKHIKDFSTAGELSITFSISDESGFRKQLAGANLRDAYDFRVVGRFGLDHWYWNVFHRGSDSLREVSEPDSLHLSIYNKGKITAHIDQVSPVDSSTRVFTSMDARRGIMHQGREAGAPALLGAIPKIPKTWTINPGLQLFPDNPPMTPNPASPSESGRLYGAFTVNF